MNILECFSGTKSVGKCCDALGWNSVSVDLLLPADHEVDIMEFDYKQYPKDHFDIIWASPPCTFYSNLQNCWIGRKRKDGTLVTKEWIEERKKESDKLIEKTLEIIQYFNPPLWFMENPATGTLKKREVVKDIPFYDCSYCMYSDWGYEKKTRIWTNKKDWKPLICDKSGSCGNMIEAQHKSVLGNGYEMINGKKTLCNTKKLRQKHKKDLGDNSWNCKGIAHKDKKNKHRLNVSKDIHTVGEKKGKHKTNVAVDFGGGTSRLDRYRIPEELIFSLFLD